MARFGRRILAPREGISAARLRAPGGTQTHAERDLPVPATVREWLAEIVIPTRLGREQAFEDRPLTPGLFVDPGELTDERGARVRLDDAVVPGGFYFFHKPVPPEKRIPFDTDVVHEDEDLIIVDKPHFLASTPNGAFQRECVVTRMRVSRGEDDIVAIHRLDRVTAGLLVLSRRVHTRGAYQMLFQQRRIRKAYRALAWLPIGWEPGAGLPLGLEVGAERERLSRLRKIDGERAVHEIAGEPNARTSIRLVRTFRHAERWVGEFALEPHTGKTHQLRVHLNALGMPLVGDPVYPRDVNPDPYDFSDPLQLVAMSLEFTDPFTGEPRAFHSRRTLDPSRG